MLSEFFFINGMQLMMLLCGIPSNSVYYLNKLIMRSGDVIFDTYNTYPNLTDDQILQTKEVRLIHNVLMYERLRVYINCHDLSRLFKRVMRQYTKVKEFRINNNSALIMTTIFGDESHSVVFYRTDDIVEVINTYGGMGKVTIKTIPYDTLLKLYSDLIRASNRGDKVLCKELVSKITGIRVIYSDYVIRSNVLTAYNFTAREIIDSMIDVVHKVDKYYTGRDEQHNIKGLIREMQLY